MENRRKAVACSRWLLLLVAGLLLISVTGVIAAQISAQPTRSLYNPNGLSYLPNEVLVTMKPGTTKADVENLCAKLGAKGYRALLVDRTYDIVLQDTPGGIPVNDKMNQIKADSKVAWADRNQIRHIAETPNDPLYPISNASAITGQWALQETLNSGVARDHIHIPEAWNLEKGKNNVVVAVIDTGVRTYVTYDDKGFARRFPHPDLGGYKRSVDSVTGKVSYQIDVLPSGMINTRLLTGFSTTGSIDKRDDAAPSDFVEDADWSGHGTQVSGVIAAKTNNNTGVAGICWNNVWVLPIRVFPDQSGGGAPSDAVADAIYACTLYRSTVNGVNLKVNVINLSLGSQQPTAVEEAAIKQATKMGIVVVAAAGNDWDIEPYAPAYPGAYDEAICVSATDLFDLITPWSQRGHAVDIAAPGSDILSTTFLRGIIDDKVIDDYYTPPETTVGGPGNPTARGSSISAATDPTAVDFEGFDMFGNGFMPESGTSFSAPIVSAAAALLISRNVKGEDVRDILCQTATPIGIGLPNDSYGWGLLNVYKAIKKACISVNVSTPSDAGIVQTLKPMFRVDLINANPDTIRVWIDPQDMDSNGVPKDDPSITGTDANFRDYYFVTDADNGKAYLQFDRIMTSGIHKIAVMAQTSQTFETPPSVPLSDYDEVQFTVSPQTLSAGWHLFAIPLILDYGTTPRDIFNTDGVFARWNYAISSAGQYALYSFDGSRTDPEASFQPPSVMDVSETLPEKIIHPTGKIFAETAPAGLGYWLYLPKGTPIPEISGQSLDSSPYEIWLYQGWNMVGNPFPFTVDWSTVVVEYAGNRVPISAAVSNGWISNVVFRYENKYNPITDTTSGRYIWSNVNAAILPAWESEWISVKVAGSTGWPQPDLKIIVSPTPYTGTLR